MGETPMPGGWSISTIWMPVCGQTWLGAAASFVRMWMLMMAAMMLPSSAPELRRLWERACTARPISAVGPALLTAACYLSWWAAAGTIVFAVGNALATHLPHAASLARLAPLSSAILAVTAGVVQFTSWKRRRIACCGRALSHDPTHALGAGAACRLGFRLALHGGCCCVNLMAVLLVIGIMNLPAMAALTAAMTVERLAPARWHADRGIGIAVVATGLCMIGNIP
ncbi:DUF2182 domain-containing protein [Trinickia dinghuensis]|nr:DUF2182 domain-containing protein [Trinickia dinghuensis]